jgi:hypothetical protein
MRSGLQHDGSGVLFLPLNGDDLPDFLGGLLSHPTGTPALYMHLATKDGFDPVDRTYFPVESMVHGFAAGDLDRSGSHIVTREFESVKPGTILVLPPSFIDEIISVCVRHLHGKPLKNCLRAQDYAYAAGRNWLSLAPSGSAVMRPGDKIQVTYSHSDQPDLIVTNYWAPPPGLKLDIYSFHKEEL